MLDDSEDSFSFLLRVEPVLGADFFFGGPRYAGDVSVSRKSRPSLYAAGTPPVSSRRHMLWEHRNGTQSTLLQHKGKGSSKGGVFV